MPLSTVLVEDSITIRENLIPALEELADAEVVGVAETATEAVALLEDLGDAWQLAVVDLFLREGSGLTVLRAGQDRRPHMYSALI
uniref:response regulator transcription factor n=1 Tax=Pseudomonas sp. 50_B TaxID=2813574 RepID=UPI001A9E62A0